MSMTRKPEPVPQNATRLVIVMAELEQTKRELRQEKARSGLLRVRLARAQQTADAKPKDEQRAGC
jgi:hypothetical protein